MKQHPATASRSSISRRAAAAWNRFWYPRSTGLNLAIARIVVVGSTLLFFTPQLRPQLALAASHDRFIDPRFVISLVAQVIPEELIRSPEFITGVYVATWIAGILTVVGLFTRPGGAIFGLGFLFLMTHKNSYGVWNHTRTLISIFFLLLPPSGWCISVDAWWHDRKQRQYGFLGPSTSTTDTMWPLRLMQWMITLCFSGQFTIWVVLSYLSILFETGFIVGILWRRRVRIPGELRRVSGTSKPRSARTKAVLDHTGCARAPPRLELG